MMGRTKREIRMKPRNDEIGKGDLLLLQGSQQHLLASQDGASVFLGVHGMARHERLVGNHGRPSSASPYVSGRQGPFHKAMPKRMGCREGVGQGRSSVNPWDSITHGERRALTSVDAKPEDEGIGDCL